MIGTIIGNWRIIAKLGEGGMGEVYLAEHIELGHRAAMKRLRPELTREPDFRQRFKREAKNQAKLPHPNIVKVFDSREQDGQYFLFMEYVEGESLDKLIAKKGRLSESEAIPILKDVLEALSDAHAKEKMIHRDVKPSNIMIDEYDRAHLMDFGIAILLGEERRTASGKDIGTSWYMSPEQIQRPKQIDPRSDVYAVGIVAYEILTGAVPFDGDTDYSVKTHQIQSPVPDPVKKNPQLARELADVVLKALQKDPDARYRTARDFLQAIEAYEKGHPSPNQTWWTWLKLKPAVWYSAAAVAIAVVSVVAWCWVCCLFDGVVDDLIELGYEPNPGLQPIFTPGNILQTVEPVANGEERQLPSPIVFAWREKCFSDKTPRRTPFPLPLESCRLSGSLTLGPGLIGELLPALRIDGGIVAEYSLQLENPQVHTFAKSDLSRAFSQACVEALRHALEDGDRIEWFKVVIESVLADGATWHTRWRAGISVEARGAQKDAILAAFGDTNVGVDLDNAQKTVIKVGAPIVLAYRTRPLQPVYGRATGRPVQAESNAEIRELYLKEKSPDELVDRIGRIAVTLVEDERERDVRLDHIFGVGDEIRFKISSNRDGRLYVLNRPPNGERRLLWPPEDNGRFTDNTVKAHQPKLIPPPPDVFRFDEETGAEQIYVVIQSKQMDNIALRAFDQTTRSLHFDPRPEDRDPHRYFKSDCGEERGCDLVWSEFKLQHAR